MKNRGHSWQTYLILGAVGFTTLSTSANNKYIADRDGNITVSCQCVVAVAACQLKLFDTLAGKDRYNWSQKASLKKGISYDLDNICFRKRDVKGAGNGLCCEVTGDEVSSVKNLFRGSAN